MPLPSGPARKLPPMHDQQPQRIEGVTVPQLERAIALARAADAASHTEPGSAHDEPRRHHGVDFERLGGTHEHGDVLAIRAWWSAGGAGGPLEHLVDGDGDVLSERGPS